MKLLLKQKRHIAQAILVGDSDKIIQTAKDADIDISDYEIVDVKDDVEAAHEAVKLVHDGKGRYVHERPIDSKNFLKSVLDKEVGLCTGRPLSHVCVFQIPGIDRLFF